MRVNLYNQCSKTEEPILSRTRKSDYLDALLSLVPMDALLAMQDKSCVNMHMLQVSRTILRSSESAFTICQSVLGSDKDDVETPRPTKRATLVGRSNGISISY